MPHSFILSPCFIFSLTSPPFFYTIVLTPAVVKQTEITVAAYPNSRVFIYRNFPKALPVSKERTRRLNPMLSLTSALFTPFHVCSGTRWSAKRSQTLPMTPGSSPLARLPWGMGGMYPSATTTTTLLCAHTSTMTRGKPQDTLTGMGTVYPPAVMLALYQWGSTCLTLPPSMSA